VRRLRAQLRRPETEPLVLPTRFPNLLVNGSAGIAVGMATNIPPHNLGEIIDATIHLIENPQATILDLMQHHPRAGLPDRRLSSTGAMGSCAPTPPVAAT
jgi:DNA gyrase/topoisomerase IV subunit A